MEIYRIVMEVVSLFVLVFAIGAGLWLIIYSAVKHAIRDSRKPKKEEAKE